MNYRVIKGDMSIDKTVAKRAAVSSVVDSRLREEQAGFRKGKRCIDQIFAF